MSDATDNKGGSNGGSSDDAAKLAAADAAAKAAAEAETNKMVPLNALHEEREKHKKTKEKLEAFEAAQIEAARKAEEEKGNFKNLYEQEIARAKKFEEELTGVKTKLTSFETAAQARIEKSINSLKSDEDKTVIKKLLEGKSFEDQENILPTLIEKFGGSNADINSNAKHGGNKGTGTDDRTVKAEEAAKKGDLLGMIANAPVLK